MGKTLICSIPFHCHSELHSMKTTSEDSFKKVFFPKFKLLNSGCSLSAGVYGNVVKKHDNYFKEGNYHL